jgi:hypothetical protein
MIGKKKARKKRIFAPALKTKGEEKERGYA